MRKQKPMRRGAGVLLPVSSLPSPYGIGSFGREAYQFVDFLHDAGQRYWQVLPLGPTSYGDSPYQSFSAFAGNPYYIDLDLLIEQGLLTQKEVESVSWGDDPASVDYALLYRERYPLLQIAFSRSKHQKTESYARFCEEHTLWLPDYCAFMAKKTQYTDDFWAFCQFHFFAQWEKLKAYANGFGIEIIGDIPIYVAQDSADVVYNPELFQLDADGHPLRVAGVPPDMFSATGQLWGNPLYDWERMEQDGFAWWRRRMLHSCKLYDIVRIDHFIGIVNYYSIPAGDDTALNGEWVKGPGKKLVEAVSSVIGNKRIIAEDLGVLSPPVVRLRDGAGYPGMMLMTFAFDSDAQNPYLPCHFEKNIVAYGGTHDNEPLAGFFRHRPRRELRFARNYLGVKRNAEIPWGLIRAGYASSANLAVFQMQDYLGLDNRARMNTPSVLGGNWCWRLTENQADKTLAKKLRALSENYGRA